MMFELNILNCVLFGFLGISIIFLICILFRALCILIANIISCVYDFNLHKLSYIKTDYELEKFIDARIKINCQNSTKQSGRK